MIFRSYVPSPVYGQQRPPLRRWSKPAETKQPGEVINVVNPCKPSNIPLIDSNLIVLNLVSCHQVSHIFRSFPMDCLKWPGRTLAIFWSPEIRPWHGLTWTTGIRQEFATLVFALHLAVLRQLALDLQNQMSQKVSLCREIDIWVFVHGHGHNKSWQNWQYDIMISHQAEQS